MNVKVLAVATIEGYEWPRKVEMLLNAPASKGSLYSIPFKNECNLDCFGHLVS